MIFDILKGKTNRYYEINQLPLTWEDMQTRGLAPDLPEKDRIWKICENCSESNAWLILPQIEAESKQYLICLSCLYVTHT